MIKRNKKGTVELSLNLIIMLIIGLVVLGLVISFVTRLINKGSNQFGSQLSSSDIKFLKNLESSCSQNFCVQSSSSEPITNIKLSGKGKLGIYLKNYNSSTISCNPGPILPSCNAFNASLYNSTGLIVPHDSNYLSSKGITLTEGQGGTTMITLTTKSSGTTPSQLQVGTYYLKIAPIPSNPNSPTAQTVTIQIK